MLCHLWKDSATPLEDGLIDLKLALRRRRGSGITWSPTERKMTMQQLLPAMARILAGAQGQSARSFWTASTGIHSLLDDVALLQVPQGVSEHFVVKQRYTPSPGAICRCLEEILSTAGWAKKAACRLVVTRAFSRPSLRRTAGAGIHVGHFFLELHVSVSGRHCSGVHALPCTRWRDLSPNNTPPSK